MRKVLKWTGIIVGAIVVILLVGYLYVSASVYGRLDKHYSVQLKPIDLTADSSSIADGKKLFLTQGCINCHGEHGEGRIFINDPKVGIIGGRNLTRGKGGLPADFDDSAWLMALRHGLTAQGKPLIIMPAYVYSRLADQEIASIIAYCKTLPPVDNTMPPPVIGPLGKVVTFFNKMPMIPAELTDHHYSAPKIIKKEVSIAYGKYLSTVCEGCHHPDFHGGENHQPGKPQVADITSKGHLGRWTPEQFIQVFRTGVTPEGKHLNNEDMPWQLFRTYEDYQLKALYLFLKSH